MQKLSALALWVTDRVYNTSLNLTNETLGVVFTTEVVSMSKQKQKSPSCWNCAHLSICFLRKSGEEALETGSYFLSREGRESPNSRCAIFDALGRACQEYKYNLDE